MRALYMVRIFIDVRALLRADKQKPNNSGLFGVDQTIVRLVTTTPPNFTLKIQYDDIYTVFTFLYIYRVCDNG